MDKGTRDVIRQHRESSELVPIDEVIALVEQKISEYEGKVPDLIRQLTVQSVEELKKIRNETQLYEYIFDWSNLVTGCKEPEIKLFLNGLGSIILRVKV